MNTAAPVAPPNLSIDALLGGKAVLHAKPRTALDWISIIRRGISAAAVDTLARTIHVTQSELAVALNIPERTLARRKKAGTLNSEESAKLVRLARVVERARTIFEDLDVALDWLKSPNAALSRATPLSLLDTEVG